MSRILNVDIGKKENKYRGKLDIAADMLSVALGKARKTRIMYQANLSYRIFKKYLNDLLQSGLVECDSDSFYMVTKKGKEFLQIYEDCLIRRKKISEEIRVARKNRLLLENMFLNDDARVLRISGGNLL